MDSTGINKRIAVIVYSFQNKELLENIENIFNSSSKQNDIFFYVIDQNNIKRKEQFESKFNNRIQYCFINWDNIKSPIYYKEKFVNKTTCDYVLHLGDGVSLCKDWDKILLLTIKEDIIFSGNTIPKLKIKNQYFIQKEKIETNKLFQETYCIDRNFIFGSKKSLMKIGYPTYLKYYGEEEAHTDLVYRSGHKIYAVPEYLYSDNTINLDEIEYVPFSLTHNYNRFVEKNIYIANNFIDQLFPKYADENVKINKLPFENNDVEYDQDKSEIDNIGGNRYLNNIREIN